MATAVAATNAVIMVSGKSGCPRAWGQACSVASNRVACRHMKEHTVFTCREETRKLVQAPMQAQLMVLRSLTGNWSACLGL